MVDIGPSPNGDNLRPHELCSSCISFWERAACLLQAQAEDLPNGDDATGNPLRLFFFSRQAHVQSAASLGCHFCSIVVGAATGCTGDHGDRQFRNGSEDSPIYVSVTVLDPDAGSFILGLMLCDTGTEVQILSDSPLHIRPITENAKSASIVSQQFLSSRLQTTTYSSATADFIKAWISECRRSHMHCGSDLLSLLSGSMETYARPRRLLDLEAFPDPERMRLIEAGDNPAWDQLEYCALSYSWGFSEPYIMTSINLATFRREMRVQVLPKLLQDAVQVARGLGLRYLWIDALCIMQDGGQSSAASDDWNDQAGKMNEIFGGAVVTIAASECFDGTQSMILPRNPLSQLTCRLDMSTGLRYEVVPSCTPHCERHAFDNARYHLDTRAWVFQERILSPRTIHLTRNFVHLECRTELRCGAMGEAGACHHSGAVAKADYQTLFSMFGPNGLYDFARDGFLSFWHGLVGRYSTTSLSRKEYLLTALAGLAAQVQAKGRLTWTFGLWREHLLQEMLWHVRGGRGTTCRERAPTWSWASIEVLQGPRITYEPSLDVSLLSEITMLPDASELARRPEPLSDNPNHRVKITGLLRPGVPDSSTYMGGNASYRKHELRVHRNCQGLQHIHHQCPFHPDYDLPDNLELHSLLMACASGPQPRGSGASQENWYTHVGLVLTPVTNQEGRYHRVGYFHMDVRDETEGDDQQLPWVLERSEIVKVEIV